ncbi:hypothetical protein [Nostoc sp.]|uniref:hypothetical protein n=1 Tax=Nostoc sp. TaxID=1180 RepID=UPI002FFCB4ED
MPQFGVKQEINKYPSGLGSFSLLLLDLFISFQLLANYDKQNEPQRQQQSLNNLPNQVTTH